MGVRIPILTLRIFIIPSLMSYRNEHNAGFPNQILFRGCLHMKIVVASGRKGLEVVRDLEKQHRELIRVELDLGKRWLSLK